ncbi:hypothetical protein GGX14DRAFT_396525 [Mycena pura]|uniref:26S proteasome regulatory subunit RPN1 n=1 Tax=Mycena pura TaxID=153505 RepID=A0AAD6Y9J4_9AGAR|nr:hypothetical protein GGX14DRAFT_396525 [Mycena pura]
MHAGVPTAQTPSRFDGTETARPLTAVATSTAHQRSHKLRGDVETTIYGFTAAFEVTRGSLGTLGRYRTVHTKGQGPGATGARSYSIVSFPGRAQLAPQRAPRLAGRANRRLPYHAYRRLPAFQSKMSFLPGVAMLLVSSSWSSNSRGDGEAEELNLYRSRVCQYVFPEDIRECRLGNTRMSSHFRHFGKEHGVTDPRSLEDVYKTHLENTRPNALANVDSARLYLGLQDASDTTIETLKAIEHPIAKTAQVIVEGCAFAGSGNVLKVQAMLHHCDEHIDMKEKDKDKDGKKDEKKDDNAEGAKEDAKPEDAKPEDAKPEAKPDDTFQAFAVIAVALISMGEEVGAEMPLRQFHHLMHYGEPIIRKAVPLAIGLNSVSNPQLPILDTLSKYSHDNDLAVALNAIFAMGLVGAGTNNARLAQMLRQLAGYYYKEPDCLFMVRIAQGLVHMGKGTIGLNPFYSDRNIMSRPAVAGLLATLTAFTDAKHFILDKYHWMMYFLVTAMYPRFLITLDEELNSKPVTVRVGQALDIVGQAGKPRTISGFQTHQTPVRLATTERAELATEEYIPFSHTLEGFVILQKNPGWEKEDKMEL